MGLLTSVMRMQYLLQFKSDLEYKIMLITQTKASLVTSNSDLLQVGNDYDPSSPIVKTLQERQNKMHALEQQLDTRMAAYKAQLKMAETEMESIRGTLDKDIQSSFSYR
ncbi:hypothetical protein J6S88_04215 [bacterium]|nr:hypothetical protein [bacterium]